MKYEISKNFFNYIILELLELYDKFRLNAYYDRSSVKLIHDVIDMLRYYRQFSKWLNNNFIVSPGTFPKGCQGMQLNRCVLDKIWLDYGCFHAISFTTQWQRSTWPSSNSKHEGYGSVVKLNFKYHLACQ